MRLAPRLDENHREIVSALRKLGYEVRSLAAMAKGFPDLLVSTRVDMWLVEVKDGDADYTPDQKDFVHGWKGKPILTFRSLEDVSFFHDFIAPGDIA